MAYPRGLIAMVGADVRLNEVIGGPVGVSEVQAAISSALVILSATWLKQRHLNI
jgi:hypothetical protein